MTELEKVQEELINLWKTQAIDLSIMSKIEFGDDVIEEVTKLQNKIEKLKNDK